MEFYNFVSLTGSFTLIGIAWLFSNNRAQINWRVVVWGLLIQFIFGLFIFTVPAGITVFQIINDGVVRVLNAAGAGSEFLFGRLALPPGTSDSSGQPSLGFFLAFQGFPTIIFFSALMAILYYYNILPFIIRCFARIFTKLMGVSGAESLCAASNIFVGVESTLTIKPHLKNMTRSELCTVLTAGMATVASNVLAVYVFSLQSLFPTIAGHLISASIMSAPAALLMSKLLFPETGHPETLGRDVHPHYEREPDVFTAIINGANTGLQLIFGIAALLMAILGIISLFDLILGETGAVINTIFGWHGTWSLKTLMGYLFYIPTLIIGIPISDALQISSIIGERMIVTELIAYQDLSRLIAAGMVNHARSIVITTYALCGFAHIASIAIFVGGASALAPDRTRDIASAGLRALVAATLACLLTACVAGTFFNQSSILLSH